MTNKANEKKEIRRGNGTTEVVFILDRSGSMCGLEADTIGGFNNMLQKLKDEGEDVIWSTVLFDHMHEVIHNRESIKKVEMLTEDDYYVRGSTALLDAIGRAIHHIAMCHKYAKAEDVPEKTLFVITTDGMENSSREYTYREIKRMIGKEEEKFGWEFMFLGANMDAVSVADRMGIRRERSATFINDSEGIRKNYEAFGGAISSMMIDGEIDECCLDMVREDFSKRSKKKR